jgi:gluconolactonase
VQNAGSPDAGTGLNKSSIIEKVDLTEVAVVTNMTNAVGHVKVQTVPSSPMVINPNG